MRALDIAGINLARLSRDRTSLFFVFLLPVVLIVVLGVIYGGRVAPRLGIAWAADGAAADGAAAHLVAELRTAEVTLEIKEFADPSALRDAVERGTIEMGIAIPPDYDAAMQTGGAAGISVLSQPDGALVIREAVAAAVARQSAQVRAARLATERGDDFDAALARARVVQQALPGVDVPVVDVGDRIFPAGGGMFSLGAQSQLVLFMFLTSLTAATQLILTRQFGVSRRMFSTPTSAATIVAGETLGRFAVAMVQGVFIVLLSALVFGVSWGNPLGASLLVVAFALTGTGFAMAIGTFASNADQAGTVGVFGGMMLGFLGGAMVPLELFGEPLRTISQFTPHAWAIQGFRALAFEGAGPAEIAVPLGVLVAFGLVPLAVATWRFRRMLAGG